MMSYEKFIWNENLEKELVHKKCKLPSSFYDSNHLNIKLSEIIPELRKIDKTIKDCKNVALRYDNDSGIMVEYDQLETDEEFKKRTTHLYISTMDKIINEEIDNLKRKQRDEMKQLKYSYRDYYKFKRAYGNN